MSKTSQVVCLAFAARAFQTEALAQLLCQKEPAARRRRSGRLSLARFCFCVTLSERGFSSVRHLDPFPVRRSLGVVVVVPVPPLVRRGLGVTFGRVLPRLLTAKRCEVEI